MIKKWDCYDKTATSLEIKVELNSWNMCQGMQKPTEMKSINEKESAWSQ